MGHMNDDRLLEGKALTRRVRQLEGNSDDNRIIGKLQREVIAMRTTYRLFARASSVHDSSHNACQFYV